MTGWLLAGFFGFAVSLSWCSYVGAALASGQRLSKGSCASSSAGFTFAFMMLPSVRAELGYSNEYILHFLPYFMASAALFNALAKRAFAVLAAGLVAFAILPGADLAAEIYSRAVRIEGELLEDNVAGEINGLTLSEEPNVHVLVYDGMPEFGTLEALGFESKEIRDLLAEFGFTVYPGTLLSKTRSEKGG